MAKTETSTNRGLSAQVTAITAPTPDIRIVTLRPDAPYAYQAGQYTAITFDGQEPRYFSIANAPQSAGNGADQHLELHVRMTGQGISRYIEDTLQQGEYLTLSPAQGTTIYHEDCTRPILAIAGGIGLSGLKAVMEEAVSAAHPAPLYLYFGGRTLEDLYALPALQRLKARHPDFHLITALSDQDHNDHHHGLIGDMALRDHHNFSAFRLYLGGPPPMVQALAVPLHAAGAQPDYIHCDMPLTFLESLKGDMSHGRK